jgi:predicted DNA-binding protein
MEKKKDFVEFSIRVPVDLNEKLEADAARAERKKNQQVNWIIK